MRLEFLLLLLDLSSPPFFSSSLAITFVGGSKVELANNNKTFLEIILSPKTRTLWLLLIFGASVVAFLLLLKIVCFCLYGDEEDFRRGKLRRRRSQAGLLRRISGQPGSPMNISDLVVAEDGQLVSPSSGNCCACGDALPSRSKQQLKSVLSSPVVKLPSNSDRGGGVLVLKPILGQQPSKHRSSKSNSSSAKSHHNFSNTPMGSFVAPDNSKKGPNLSTAKPISELGFKVASGGVRRGKSRSRKGF